MAAWGRLPPPDASALARPFLASLLGCQQGLGGGSPHRRLKWLLLLLLSAARPFAVVPWGEMPRRLGPQKASAAWGAWPPLLGRLRHCPLLGGPGPRGWMMSMVSFLLEGWLFLVMGAWRGGEGVRGAGEEG